jgi:hypothetical protein
MPADEDTEPACFGRLGMGSAQRRHTGRPGRRLWSTVVACLA